MATRALAVPAGDAGRDDPALARATLHRVTLRILPFVFVLYLVNFLDRTNVAMAALQMNHDLGFSATAYGLGVGIFFLSYTVFEVPANLMLARLGARRWIAAIMVAWGIVASAMMLVRTPAEFYALRFALGVAEAGFFPGIVYYLGQWFPPRQRARAMSRFMLGIPISAAVGGPLGAALLGLHGLGLRGWQWLFLLEGLPAILLSSAVVFFLTDRPEEARWLSDDQRAWLVARLRLEADAQPHGALPPLRALGNARVWMLSLPYLLIVMAGYTFTFWAPTLIRDGLHAGNLATGLMFGGMAAISAVAMVAVSAASDRAEERVYFAAACIAICGLGCMGAAVLPTPTLRIAALVLVAIGQNAFLPIFWCLPSTFLRGSGAAAAIGLVNGIGNIGGFTGPYLVGFLRDATGTTTGAFIILGSLALAGATILALSRRSVLSPMTLRVEGTRHATAAA